LRLIPAIADFDVVFVATNEKYLTMILEHRFYKTTDFNRWNPIRMIFYISDGFKIIIK